MESLLSWWQHLPEHIDPVLLQIGSFRLQYYGLMYLVGFAVTYWLALYRIKTEKRWEYFSKEHLQGLITAMIVGLIVGARLGYVLFYKPAYYAAHPLEIILPFEFRNGFRFTGISGMSYHGGLIGAFLGLCYYTRKYKLGIANGADLLAPGGALGYTFGRLGNFINGELWGRVTTSPIGMYFPHADGDMLRHPSQLYEAFGEGLLLFIFLWSIRRRAQTPGAIFSLYLAGYATARFVIEFFREPDAHLGFIFWQVSMGQILSSLMFVAALTFYFISKRSAEKG